MNYCYQCKYAKPYTAGTKTYIFCKKIYDELRPEPRAFQTNSVTHKEMSYACSRFQPKKEKEEK